ncbi:MAG: 50S ribosomal protein L32 [Patescibacteria group bacterium]
MGTPKKHKTHAGKRQRRSHHALKKVNIFSCPKCKTPLLPHRVCLKCGTYADRQAMVIKEKKKQAKKKSATSKK